MRFDRENVSRDMPKIAEGMAVAEGFLSHRTISEQMI
jgi:hypothetical protein